MTESPLERALRLRAATDYHGALVELLRAEDSDTLLERGRIQEELGEYEEAEHTLTRVLDDRERRPLAFTRLAVVLRSKRQPREAEASAVEAVDLARVNGDGTALADALIELANAKLELDGHDRAEEALVTAQPFADDAAPGIAGERVRFGLRIARAGVLRQRGRYAEAERSFVDASDFAEAAFGSRSIELGGALNGLGMVFKYWGRFDDGKDVYLHALSILEHAFGERHPDIASLHHNLGGLEHGRRRYAEAEPHARKSVAIRAATLGSDHPTVAEDEAALASILHALGQDEEAERLLRRALPVLERVFGRDHLEYVVNLNNLGAILEARGRYEEAEAAYREALAGKERALPPDHPSIAASLNNLAVLERRRGRLDQAEELYRRALSILERALDPDHPNLVVARKNYKRVLEARKKAGPEAV